MTRVSQLFLGLVLSIACIHAQTQCGGMTCNDSTQYCESTSALTINIDASGRRKPLARDESLRRGGVCRDYVQLNQDCTGGRKCTPGLKCDSYNSGKCISEEANTKCTACGLPAGSDGPCCAPALGSTEKGKVCYCVIGRNANHQ